VWWRDEGRNPNGFRFSLRLEKSNNCRSNKECATMDEVAMVACWFAHGISNPVIRSDEHE